MDRIRKELVPDSMGLALERDIKMLTTTRPTQLLKHANSARDGGDKREYVCAVLEAVMETARLRFGHTQPMNDEARFVKFLEEEWVIFNGGIKHSDQRRVGNAMLTISAIFYRLHQAYVGGGTQPNIPLTLQVCEGRQSWFEPEGEGFVLSESWFHAMAKIVAYSPENCPGEAEDAPDSIVSWALFGRPDVSHDLGLNAYMKVRAERLEKARDARMRHFDALIASPPGNIPSAYHPDDRDELAYQIINLRLLCQYYNQGMKTLYKPASVCLRTLLLVSSGCDPLALKLGTPQLPQLLVTNITATAGHFTVPSRFCIGGRTHFSPGSGFKNINVAGGATDKFNLEIYLQTNCCR